jgi:hypothetical protein
VAMQTCALVPLWHIGQAMRCLYLENSEYVHA